MKYVEGWKQYDKPVALTVGTQIHRAIAKWLQGEATHPRVEDLYGIQDPNEWAYWSGAVGVMLNSFKSHMDQLRYNLFLVEKSITREGYRGTIDCIMDLGDSRIVVDWKTASKPYSEGQVDLSNQLTGYAYLAGLLTKIDEVAFVTIGKPNGEVNWYRSRRTTDQIDQFRAKVDWVRKQMDAGVNFKRPDFVRCYGGCVGCSFKGHCLGIEDLEEKNFREDF